MNETPSSCPMCQGKLRITGLRCSDCGVGLDGAFDLPVLARLPKEDQDFAVRYLFADGSLKDVAEQMGVTYPTVRVRLDRLVTALKKAIDDDKSEKDRILSAVERGDIPAKEAVRRLKGGRG